MLFRKGQGTTFRSGADRSGGALRAESVGLESAIDAARRLKIRPWKRLHDAYDAADLASERSPFILEQHHIRTKAGVEYVMYARPEEWDALMGRA